MVGEGSAKRAIAYRTMTSAKPGATGIFWLSGFMSDMGSTKAMAVAEWATARGLGATRFDYSGHGVSGGAFAEGTIGRWLEEANAVFTQVTSGPQVIIGSSMGGHIALLLVRKLLRDQVSEAQRIKGLVLIAPAWDMTEELMWKRFGDDVRRTILERGCYEQPSAYGSPYPITRGLIEDGRKHLLAREPFDPEMPVVILQGLLDPDVPADHTRELTRFLTGDRVKLIEIPDGEHRLSRPQDLALLFDAVGALV
ncbi:alpha/beta hydrolase [Hyphomicrobium sp.]|jgi:alpha-beta hydrolase superfamily lysophospholipase|uniref:alpha/beta hydrolase n=1 Tax=Hyphomicrobium sp. TaxID=82 RepID=UPI002CD61512|nr:alpha/beta hydrolase [Hyphomicrobium sp.]HVZ03299.1 alpha/beta hydrolase [Hyphomicrobium sp.]